MPERTKFASEERTPMALILEQNEYLKAAPNLMALLNAVTEPVLLLNQDRQILLSNDAGLRFAGQDESAIVGKRPGEALNCANWTDSPFGCGTGWRCTFCGVMKAILESQCSGRASRQQSRLTVKASRDDEALDLEVTVTPARIGDIAVGICAIRDISSERRREFLERAFSQDALTALGGLRALLEIWADLPPEEGRTIQDMAIAVVNTVLEEIRLCRELSAAESGALRPYPRGKRVAEIFSGLTSLYARHPVAEDRQMIIADTYQDEVITDPGLLQRALGSLLKNALEATPHGGTVTVSFSAGAGGPAFHVHNQGLIPPDDQQKIFLRGFTTKLGPGRGTGTYSARLLIERYLRGKLSFTSTAESGTTFTVQLPELVEPIDVASESHETEVCRGFRSGCGMGPEGW